MNKNNNTIIHGLLVLFVFATTANAQTPINRLPRVSIPKSSLEKPTDFGRRFHTNIQILGSGAIIPPQGVSANTQGPPYTGYFNETPASLACIYNLVSSSNRDCNPNVVTANPTGGARAIAIVDAYDDPNAASDLATFSAQFGIPFDPSKFQVVYASGTNPGLDPTGGWEIEESLDIEYAHAMAPDAMLYLVEAASDSTSDLLAAVTVAAQLVAKAGGGQVSSSWGGSEFDGQNTYDSVFQEHGVVFFASAGDVPGTEWPSTSPNVVAVGGTSTNRNPTTGNFMYEGAWNNGGGGLSQYEAIPSYQASRIANIAGTMRAVPDMSAVANPNTGVWVYNSNDYEGSPGGWMIIGGTSVAAPLVAGIVNAAGVFHTSSEKELDSIYTSLGNHLGFTDIVYDNCGPYGGYLTLKGYDLCTGVGSPNGYTNK
jgi:subtilase family serine protease